MKMFAGENFTKPSYSIPCIAETFCRIQCGKGRRILSIIFNAGEKNLQIKFSPTRAGGEKSENLS